MMLRHPVEDEQHIEVGALKRAARQGTFEAGWRAIAGQIRDYPTAEDIKEAEDKEDEVTTRGT